MLQRGLLIPLINGRNGRGASFVTHPYAQTSDTLSLPGSVCVSLAVPSVFPRKISHSKRFAAAVHPPVRLVQERGGQLDLFHSVLQLVLGDLPDLSDVIPPSSALFFSPIF